MSIEARKKGQRRNPLSQLCKAGLASAALLIASLGAHAAVGFPGVDIGINKSYNGTPPHSSTTPWVNFLFQDIAKNTVQLSITAPNLTNPEFIQNLFLNFNDTKTVTSLIFTPVWSMWHGLATAYSLIESKNNEQASTGGKYDLELGFQTSGGLSSQFNRGDQVVFDITTRPGQSISSQDFAFLSVPGTVGSFYAAAHFGGTGSNGKGTDYAGATSFTVLGVPEPASGFTAAACCFAGLYGMRRVKTALRSSLA